MPRRYYSSTAARTTLSSGINSSVTSITVASTSGFPASFPYTLIIDQDLVTEEIVTVTAASGTTLTVTRGVDGTSAVSHSASAPVNHGVSARDFDEPNAHVNDATTDVHSQYVLKSLLDAKGDLISASADNTPAKVTVGANNTVLVANSSASAGVNWSATLSGLTLSSPTVNTPIVLSPEERCNVVASAATGTINLNFLTASVWFYTSNASANHTLNIRGDASNTLNSLLAVGDSITVAWLVTNGATPYYPNVIQVDGSNVTPKWQGGSAPSAGNASSIDVYTFTVIKTAATPTYTVLGSQTRFA